MIDYKNYEKEVYNWLNNKNKHDLGFTFSLRQNGSKGSELDYFIGTEKSRYFGVTFWVIPVGYPGSSGDCIDLIFKLSADYLTYSYNFEFTQTNLPEEGQNTSVLHLIKSLTTPLENAVGNSYVSPVNNKMFTIKTKSSKNNYLNLDEMLADIDQDLLKIIPIVNKHIEDEKKVNPEFIANRISKEDFAKMKSKLQVRFEKYAGLKDLIEEGEINLKDEFIVWLLNKPKSNYFNNDREKLSSYLDTYNTYFDVDIFKVSMSNYKNVIDVISQEAYIDESSEFYNYSDRESNHRPRAILGKTNYYQFLEGKFNKSNHNIIEESTSKKFPLNQILYGPPGTGKTYNTVTESVAIIKNIPSNEIRENKRETVKSDFDKLLKKNQILFTTFHQSMSYEDFIEGIKPKLVSDSDQETDEVTYEITPGVFKHAVARAAYNSYREYHNVGTTKYTFSQLYDAFIEIAREKIIKEDYLICETKTGFFVEIYRVNKNDSIKARAKGSHASHVAPLTKENIQKLYDTYKSINEIKNLQEVREVVGVSPRTTEFYAVFKSLLNFEKESFNPTIENEELLTLELSDDEIIRQFDSGVFNEMSRKHGKASSPVVLIIDEINRGNVSAIFGELITLLEDDKRLGIKNELLVTLPYSKNKFSVPANLYIIGTMNTADRSVEALDSALRRRFSFIEMMPDYDLQELNTDLKVNLSHVLKAINQRIEILLDREHQIGHSYFINIETEFDLQNAFENKIIPLLQEYFYNDYDKIGLILGTEFINKTVNPKISFANFSFENREELIQPIYNWVELNKENIVQKVNSILSSSE